MATMNPPVNERRHLSDRRSAQGNLAKAKLNALDWIAMVLTIAGGLSWGLVGLVNYDVVATAFGAQSPYARVLYVVVGLAALYAVYTAIKMAARQAPQSAPY
ncbi:MAG: DUF378 domain-containing protein [Pseudomonadota bacterium]